MLGWGGRFDGVDGGGLVSLLFLGMDLCEKYIRSGIGVFSGGEGLYQ